MTEEQKTTESENQEKVDTTVQTTTFDDGIENTGDTQEKTVESGQEQEQQQATETKEDETETKPINQEAVDKKINKLTFKRHEEKRKREEAEQKLAQTQAELEALKKPDEGEQPVPEMPDMYDSDFDKKVKERDAILLKNAEVRAQKKLRQEQLIQEQAAQQQKVVENTKKLISTMYEKAAENGFNQEEFQKADQRVAMFVQDPALQDYILKQDNASLIVNYLAQNVGELEKVSQMDTLNAAVHISGVVEPEAVKFKPSTTKTPDPLNLPKGKGAGEKQSQYLDGVQME